MHSSQMSLYQPPVSHRSLSLSHRLGGPTTGGPLFPPSLPLLQSGQVPLDDETFWQSKGKRKLCDLEVTDASLFPTKKLILAPLPMPKSSEVPLIIFPIFSILQKSKKALTAFKCNQTRLKKMAKAIKAKAKLMEDPFHALLDSQADEASLYKPPPSP